MRIIQKITISFLVVVALVAATVAYSSTSLDGTDASVAVVVLTIVFIDMVAMGILGYLLTRIVFKPLERLMKGADQIATGNFNYKVYNEKIDKDRIKDHGELFELILTFETMRRKILELESKLRVDLERASDELIEKEKVLHRANARLMGQSEELKKINEELSSKNQELSKANAKLQELDKMKTDFILVAAHELRTPIQPIIGAVKLAEKGLINNEEAWKTIALESKRLAGVATYILDVSKIEHGIFTYSMKPLSVKHLIEEITLSSSKFATEDGIVTIKTDLDNDVRVLGDKERLLQAFANIIDNAVKFAKDGIITIQTRNSDDKKMVEIKIVDDGPGIPPEILPVLFSKFVTKTPANLRGTGLGLYITKAIVEAHKGSVRARNNNGANRKGATFTVSLPIHARLVADDNLEVNLH